MQLRWEYLLPVSARQATTVKFPSNSAEGEQVSRGRIDPEELAQRTHAHGSVAIGKATIGDRNADCSSLCWSQRRKTKRATTKKKTEHRRTKDASSLGVEPAEEGGQATMVAVELDRTGPKWSEDLLAVNEIQQKVEIAAREVSERNGLATDLRTNMACISGISVYMGRTTYELRLQYIVQAELDR